MRSLGNVPARVAIPASRQHWVLLGVLGSLALGAIGSGAAPAETRWVFLKARAAKERLHINVSGNDRTYYRLDGSTPVEFSATGPTRIKLITRHLDSADGGRRTAYTLRATRGAGEKIVLLKEIRAEETEEVLYSATGDPVGEGEESLLYVPRGKWDFKIFLHEGETGVAVRLLQEKRAKHEALVHCTPDDYERILVLVQPSGNEYPHYHFTRERPLRVSLRGPATISIRTRLDFAPNGREIAPYGIEVIGSLRRDGVLLEELHETAYYWARRLEKAHYREARDILPGESMELDIDLSEGEWVLEIRPVGEQIRGAAARVLGPKRALTEDSGE